jgi:hypothetical protein
MEVSANTVLLVTSGVRAHVFQHDLGTLPLRGGRLRGVDHRNPRVLNREFDHEVAWCRENNRLTRVR